MSNHEFNVRSMARRALDLTVNLFSLDIDEINPGLSRKAVKVAAAAYRDIADRLDAESRDMRTTMHNDMGVDPAYLTECPDMYDTIIGFQARRGMVIGERYGVEDGRRVSRYVKGSVYLTQAQTVVAPPVLQAIGIKTVNAYPIDVLQEVLVNQDPDTQQYRGERYAS